MTRRQLKFVRRHWGRELSKPSLFAYGWFSRGYAREFGYLVYLRMDGAQVKVTHTTRKPVSDGGWPLGDFKWRGFVRRESKGGVVARVPARVVWKSGDV